MCQEIFTQQPIALWTKLCVHAFIMGTQTWNVEKHRNDEKVVVTEGNVCWIGQRYAVNTRLENMRQGNVDCQKFTLQRRNKS